MKEELPCGCVITETDYLEEPPLEIETCDDHNKGYLYVNGSAYNLSHR